MNLLQFTTSIPTNSFVNYVMSFIRIMDKIFELSTYFIGQPQVASASVNLTTETAVVWPVSEAKVAPNWQKIVGDALANHLTNCGFKSNLQGVFS